MIPQLYLALWPDSDAFKFDDVPFKNKKPHTSTERSLCILARVRCGETLLSAADVAGRSLGIVSLAHSIREFISVIRMGYAVDSKWSSE